MLELQISISIEQQSVGAVSVNNSSQHLFNLRILQLLGFVIFWASLFIGYFLFRVNQTLSSLSMFRDALGIGFLKTTIFPLNPRSS